MGAGRFAPSPSGALHLGNLRTAVLAWLFARSTQREFLLRIEDLDRVRSGAEAIQISELESLGLQFDGSFLRQSERLPIYFDAVEQLKKQDLVFPCFCSRKDIAEAASAPHAAPGAYPGTCRDLSPAEREAKSQDRPAALRLRAEVTEFSVHDQLAGGYTGVVDDFVLVRNDAAPAYNLAVVVDDALSGIDQVVRGDDLLSSAPRQAYLATLLGYDVPEYAHVPLALNTKGQRLAKRDGAVTLEEITEHGVHPADVVAILLESLGLPSTSLLAALEAFDPVNLPREPWIVKPENIVQQLMPPASRNR